MKPNNKLRWFKKPNIIFCKTCQHLIESVRIKFYRNLYVSIYSFLIIINDMGRNSNFFVPFFLKNSARRRCISSFALWGESRGTSGWGDPSFTSLRKKFIKIKNWSKINITVLISNFFAMPFYQKKCHYIFNQPDITAVHQFRSICFSRYNFFVVLLF